MHSSGSLLVKSLYVSEYLRTALVVVWLKKSCCIQAQSKDNLAIHSE
jgi:hypothetical protein